MKTALISLTRGGSELAVRLAPQIGADIYIKEAYMTLFRDCGSQAGCYPINEDFSGLVGRLFSKYEALVFIMACGIVVRAIAPFVKDKKTDPAVVVMDEKGEFSISLLSGHVGGANRLAQKIAGIAGSMPVITTATDVNGVVAFDVFAKENDCIIENFKDVKYISRELVNGRKVALYSDVNIEALPSYIIRYDEGANTPYEYVVAITNKSEPELNAARVLLIRPRNLILGIGCRKGVPAEQIEAAILDFMNTNKKSLLSVKCLATIDLKKDEEGINVFCKKYSIELTVVPRDEIEKLDGKFTGSEFVKEKVGVGGVAEPCSLLAGKEAKLLCGKTKYRGITLALSEEEKIFQI